jgi:hypothetical protein
MFDYEESASLYNVFCNFPTSPTRIRPQLKMKCNLLFSYPFRYLIYHHLVTRAGKKLSLNNIQSRHVISNMGQIGQTQSDDELLHLFVKTFLKHLINTDVTYLHR